MTTPIVVKQNDRRPPIVRILKDAADVVIDLTGATIKFIMSDLKGVVKVNSACTIVLPATDGKVQYDWAAIDVDTAGSYRGEFEITFSDAKKMSVPNDSYIPVSIVPEVA